MLSVVISSSDKLCVAVSRLISPSEMKFGNCDPSSERYLLSRLLLGGFSVVRLLVVVVVSSSPCSL